MIEAAAYGATAMSMLTEFLFLLFTAHWPKLSMLPQTLWALSLLVWSTSLSTMCLFAYLYYKRHGFLFLLLLAARDLQLASPVVFLTLI